jgi:hypothetical protein
MRLTNPNAQHRPLELILILIFSRTDPHNQKIGSDGPIVLQSLTILYA